MLKQPPRTENQIRLRHGGQRVAVHHPNWFRITKPYVEVHPGLAGFPQSRPVGLEEARLVETVMTVFVTVRTDRFVTETLSFTTRLDTEEHFLPSTPLSVSLGHVHVSRNRHNKPAAFLYRRPFRASSSHVISR